MTTAVDSDVLVVADIDARELASLLRRFDLELRIGEDGEAITSSFWGEPEAGIIGKTVHVRVDTPIHSLLHETSHVICMTQARRARLDRDAGGDDLEEAAVCYLQIILADHVNGVGRERVMRDMDAWGYSFRSGSTRKWFEQDAEDARDFLINQHLLTQTDTPTFTLRS